MAVTLEFNLYEHFFLLSLAFVTCKSSHRTMRERAEKQVIHPSLIRNNMKWI